MDKLQINGSITDVAVVIADTIMKRTVGLMGEKRGDHTLLLPHCGSIHTCFMRYPIDVVCLDERYAVIRTVDGCKPWRIVLPGKDTRHILEVPSRRFPGLVLKPGDVVGIEGYIP
jgi:uncharacterized membrane protein (UPF0127 family)